LTRKSKKLSVKQNPIKFLFNQFIKKHMYKKVLLFILLSVIASCSVNQEVVYFQDAANFETLINIYFRF